jgi:hypothetical protein
MKKLLKWNLDAAKDAGTHNRSGMFWHLKSTCRIIIGFYD